MRIIKPGNPDVISRVIRFHCKNCDCIFEANKEEYRILLGQYNGDELYESVCPECGEKVYLTIGVKNAKK